MQTRLTNPPLVYTITLNWNRLNDTLECLDSLCRLTYPNTRLLIVDNGSTDGSPQAISSRYPNVEQIINNKNLGFAGGFNVGFRHALQEGADYVFIVNNDTTVAPDSLNLLVNAAEPTDVGILSPLIYYSESPNEIWSAGAGRNPWTLEITEKHGRGRIFTEIVEREFLPGCGMLIKRSVLEEVGLFDEQFFLYYEDSDYSLRARQSGFRLLLVPQASMWHKVSRSSEGSDSPTERYWMSRSSLLFFRKHINGWRWLAVIPWRAGSAIKTILRLIRTGRSKAARAYWRGLMDGIFSPLLPN